MKALVLTLSLLSAPAAHTPAQGTLQALIDAAPDGAVVELEGRRYSTSEALLIERRIGLTLRGQEGTEIVCRNETANVIQIAHSLAITIEGLSAYHELPVEGCAGSVVSVDTSRDVRIEGCELNGCGVEGVAAERVVGLAVVNNEIHRNSYRGISLATCDDVSLTGNALHDNGEAYSARGVRSVTASGNTLEGELWTPANALPPQPELFWATTAQQLKDLPAGVRRLALFQFEDDALLELGRFEALEELTATPSDTARGTFLDRLVELPSLRKLTLDAGKQTRARTLARRLAVLENIDELHLRAGGLEQPTFGDRFLSDLLRSRAPLSGLKVLTIEDDAGDLGADALAGLAKLANLEELSLSRVQGEAIQLAWLDPLAAVSRLRVLNLTFIPPELLGAAVLSEDAADSLGGLARLESLTLLDLDLGDNSDLDFLGGIGGLTQLTLRLDPLMGAFRGFSASSYRSVSALQALEELHMSGLGPEADLDQCAQALWKLPALRVLEIDFAPPATTLEKLPRTITELSLVADFETGLDAEQWAALAKLASRAAPQSLSLTGRQAVPGDFLDNSSLVELELVGLDVGELDWEALAPTSSLLNLELDRCTGVDAEGLLVFRRMNPACLVR